MIDTARLSSRRLAAFGVIGLALLIGVFLLVRVTFRPAYEATAVFTVGLDDPASRPDLEEERLVFMTPRIANDAAALTAELGRGEFGWYQIELADTSVELDSRIILNSYRIETRPDADQIVVRFRADDPTVAWAGANLVVEAYRRFRPEVGRPSCWGPYGRWGDCPPLEPPTVTSISFAPTPTTRIDRPDGADVFRFLLVSLLAVYLSWRWWPADVRETAT